MVGSERQHGVWRYTWEAQSHTPTLRLLLFPLSKIPNLSLQCLNLTVRLHSSHSFLIVTSSALSLRVLLPTVLVDADSPPTFRALSDHIEVKLLLLVPVDHPVLSALNPPPTSPQQDSQPLLMESDVKKLSSKGEVDFFCRRCGFQLTKNPLRNFVEMPSANWREVADNWFGACCCSFGGISEKLVMRYVKSHTCTQGMCLLSPASVTVCMDDLVNCKSPEYCGSIVDNPGDDDVSKGEANFVLNKERTSTHSDAGEVTCAFDEDLRISHPENEKLSVNFRYDAAKNEPDRDSSHSRPDSNNLEDVAKTPSCCAHMTSVLGDEEGEHYLCGTARNGGMPTGTMEILGNEKSLLNGFLEVTRAFDEDLRISHPENEKLSVNFRYDAAKNEPDCNSSHSRPDLNNAEDVAKTPSCCAHMTSVCGDEEGEHHLCGTARSGGMATETMEILGNQKSLLNGFLEDVFMARLSNLSKDIVWHEYTCPECISLVGAYPCCEGDSTPVDGGVRLFKCYISTCAPVGGSGDVFFSKYTLGKMFAKQLMECANDESSFRFVIRDLSTKSPVSQIILLNPDTWSCSSYCSITEVKDPVPKLHFQPIIKVLFSNLYDATESQLRMVEEWAAKNSAEDIFMMDIHIQELLYSLMSANEIYPPSCASLQGLILSSLQRQ